MKNSSPYKIKFTGRFVRSYKELEKATRTQVDKALQLLITNPKHPSLRVKRIKGTKNIWEARVDMSIRITLRFEGNVIQLRNVGTHDEVFRPPY